MIGVMTKVVECAVRALQRMRTSGVGWYDSVAHEWRWERLESDDAVRAAIGINSFFYLLRVWELEQAAKVKR